MNDSSAQSLDRSPLASDMEKLTVNNGRDQLFGIGLGIGILLGLLLGSILAARLGSEASEAIRSIADRVLRRREQVRFELLLQ